MILNYIGEINFLKTHTFLSIFGSFPPIQGWMRNKAVSQHAIFPKQHNRIRWIEIEHLEFSLALSSFNQYYIYDMIHWANHPEELCVWLSNLEIWKRVHDHHLCKPIFLKIIFLYLKRLWDSQMCALGKINQYVKRLCVQFLKTHWYHLNWLHIACWQSNFCISIVG